MEHAGVANVQASNFDRLSVLLALPPVRAPQVRISSSLRHGNRVVSSSTLICRCPPWQEEDVKAGPKREAKNAYVVFGSVSQPIPVFFGFRHQLLSCAPHDPSQCLVIECVLQIIGPRALLYGASTLPEMLISTYQIIGPGFESEAIIAALSGAEGGHFSSPRQ